MKTKILLAALTAMIFTSCTMQQKIATSKSMDIYGAGVIQNPVVVDLDVKETKVTGTASAPAGQIEILKSEAVADALKASNADVLIEPKYDVQISGGQATVVVTGWPGSYKNFRAIKEDDLKLLNAGVSQKAKVYEPPVQPKQNPKKGKAAGAVGGSLLGIILVVLLVALATS
jgi:hypothetical protein